MIAYEYHPDAEAEYLDAVHYYSRIETELGFSFVDEIEAAVNRAREFPEAYGKVSGELRHVLTHRFSYSILYEISLGRIFIWAVMHSSRKPGFWKERFNNL